MQVTPNMYLSAQAGRSLHTWPFRLSVKISARGEQRSSFVLISSEALLMLDCWLQGCACT